MVEDGAIRTWQEPEFASSGCLRSNWCCRRGDFASKGVLPPRRDFFALFVEAKDAIVIDVGTADTAADVNSGIVIFTNETIVQQHISRSS